MKISSVMQKSLWNVAKVSFLEIKKRESCPQEYAGQKATPMAPKCGQSKHF
jgi:hypothetical protein